MPPDYDELPIPNQKMKNDDEENDEKKKINKRFN